MGIRATGTNSRQNIIIPNRNRRILGPKALDALDRVPFDQDPGIAQFGMLADILVVQIIDGALGGDIVHLEVGGPNNVTLVRLAQRAVEGAGNRRVDISVWGVDVVN